MLYKHGIDCIDKADAILSGKKLGLITNYTGLNSKFERSVDIINARYNLIKLFAPEHGLYGINQAGDEIENIIDEKSGLPVLSMFKEGSSMDISGLDTVVYDIQDIGLRFFTHISILAQAMQECAKAGVSFVVLDRYNPLGLNRLSGTVLEKAFSSIVGTYEIPSQYGLTVGEYARYINTEENIGCSLEVITCDGLSRSDDFSSLNVEWIIPSPNCPTIDTARAYIGTVVFEGTNVSEGRGTTRPFELIGAPWIDDYKLAEQMNVSVHYLTHLFKSFTGTTLVAYRNELRLTRAKELLVGTALSVGEIAEQTGFSGAAYFTEVFTASESIPPSEYRKYHTKL
jgi:uncharacterized protein YbbC (DUF1343 family)